MMLGYKLKSSSTPADHKHYSFSHPNPRKKQVKNSELGRYIDSYLIQSKQKTLPELEKKVKKLIPLKPVQALHSFCAPIRLPSDAEKLITQVLTKNKRKTPVFSEMRKRQKKGERRYYEVSRSHDDKIMMHIQGISDRPKSVVKQQVSSIIQTDDLYFS